MRKTSLMLVAAMLLSSGNLFAFGPKDTNPAEELKNQVKERLNGYFEKSTHKALEASILFTVNREGEIVVLSVDTEHEGLERFVKARLNYHKVLTDGAIQGRRYTIPLRVESSRY
ncbi:hypothetical protein FK220_000765 [Flavobacteriaceae bacterium TP-CH-4]|uniref:TonB C-terminal domain-containing protein n=1 Tax=Pelagihabitans pacificus TaxID=2696054 RepID=A0A967AUI9_9FLAO|nr:hypothetical protein [Pelagihabitans pacificus]NHF57852.1 hypothetical protein [Pelagihabitans pacificus]